MPSEGAPNHRSVAYTDKISAAEGALARLVDAGFPTAAVSRFARALTAVRAAVARGRLAWSDAAAARSLHQGKLDLGQLVRIVDAWLPDAGDPAVAQRLRALLGGDALPEGDATESAGRDAQAELHVGAQLRQAGLPCQVAEPDFLVTVADTRLGIAVKRVKSDRRLEKRAGQAAQQIAGQALDGVVVLEVSELVAAEGRLWLAAVDEPLPQRCRAVAADFAGRAVAALQGRSSAGRVCGVIVAVSTSSVLLDLRRTGDILLWSAAETRPLGDPGARAFRDLATRVHGALAV